jgi:uncharacterized membrane protein YhiD involved in acid resistance
MRTGTGVQGLTTAATVWVNAAIGVAAGGGRYHLAFIATAVTMSVLLLIAPIEATIDRRLGIRKPSAPDEEKPEAPTKLK